MKKWIYRHYKGKLYEIIWEAKDSETLEDFVVYRGLYTSEEFWETPLWIRPIKSFLEEVNIEWKMIQRFEYVWDQKYENL